MMVNNLIYLTILLLPTILIVVNSRHSNESVEYYQDLLQNFLETSSAWRYPVNSKSSFHASNEESINWGNFDFIIVGAGVAGSVLINRLTESGKFKVLVLEAGGFENDFTDVPGFAGYLVKSDFNWGYKTVPQNNSCLGMKNAKCNYPRGKAVGGGSVINYLVYVRGNKEDFNEWGAANPGWDYESVLPYFKKSEKSAIEFEESEFHGHEGLLSVENSKHYPQITEMFLKSVKQMGKKVLDYNGQDQMGYSRVQVMTENGRRCSGSKAFVKPAMGRKNLQLVVRSFVIRVLIRDSKAYGVEFIQGGRKYHATASKEVILSAGVFNSAQLLMLSGIGPKDHLKELDIPLVQDLPVGKFLHDHEIFPAMIFSTNLSVERPHLAEHINNYLKGSGPLTTPTLTGIGFESLRRKSSKPTIEYVFFDFFPEETGPLFLDFFGITEENWLALVKPIWGRYSWCLMPLLLHPKSAGTLRLKSKDPMDFPLIDPNLHSDLEEEDLEEMLTAIREIFEISQNPAFQRIGSRYHSDPIPACARFQQIFDDYWRCALKHLSYPIAHAVATCRMGPESDKTAVVDSRLRVYGVDSLRVVDGSVIPFSLSSHPAPAAYMVGEKGADLIREDYGDL